MTACRRPVPRGLRRPWLAAALALAWAGPAAAQADLPIRTPGGGERPFAEPLYWLNATGDDRLPIRERPMVPQVGLTAKAPPPPRRAGVSPWIGTAIEANNEPSPGDLILTVTPGIGYRYRDRRLDLDASYAVEAGLLPRDPDRSQAIRGQGGQVNLDYVLTDRSRLSFTNVFSDTRDLSAAPVKGVLTEGTRLISNTAIARYEISPTSRSTWSFGVANRQNWVIAPGSMDIVEHEVSAEYGYRLSPTARATFSSSAAWADFGTIGGASVVSANVGYLKDLGPRLSFGGTVGVLHTSGNGGRTRPDFGFELIRTDRFAEYRLVAARDIAAIPGLTALARSDGIEGRARIRLARGLILGLSLGLQELEVYDASADKTSLASAGGSLSYALRDDTWVFVQLDHEVESAEGASQTETRLRLGISRGF